jgi:hypothetical protein
MSVVMFIIRKNVIVKKFRRINPEKDKIRKHLFELYSSYKTEQIGTMKIHPSHTGSLYIPYPSHISKVSWDPGIVLAKVST